MASRHQHWPARISRRLGDGFLLFGLGTRQERRCSEAAASIAIGYRKISWATMAQLNSVALTPAHPKRPRLTLFSLQGWQNDGLQKTKREVYPTSVSTAKKIHLPFHHFLTSCLSRPSHHALPSSFHPEADPFCLLQYNLTSASHFLWPPLEPQVDSYLLCRETKCLPRASQVRWLSVHSPPERTRTSHRSCQLLPANPACFSVLYSLYIYEPNKVAPVVFSILYALSAGFHTWQC